MVADTTIEWTDKVWNPTVGCTRISEGCRHCYAFAVHDKRHAAFQNGAKLPQQYAKPFTELQLMDDDRLQQPLHWRKPQRIFVNSMSDLFHKDVPFWFVDRVFAIMALCPQHTFQVLTKRPERMAAYFTRNRWEVANQCAYFIPDRDFHKPRCGPGTPSAAAIYEGIEKGWRWPLFNVHLGTSVERQPEADERIPHLLRCPAAVRFLSIEPLLGEVYLPVVIDTQEDCTEDERDDDVPECSMGGYGSRIDWVIVGGESGAGARPVHPAWVRSIRDECEAASVPFFFKQWGQWVPYEPDAQPPFWSGQDGEMIDGHSLPDNLTEHEPIGEWWAPELDSVLYRRVGKKRAGNLLDGSVWQQFPETAGARA